MNNQPWRFVTITDPAVLDNVKDALTPGNYWAKKAPAIVAAVTDEAWSLTSENRHYAPFELGMATMAYQIQAVAEGLYVHPIVGFDEQKVKHALGIEGEQRVFVLLILGYPGSGDNLNEKHQQIEKSPRRRLEREKVHAFDHWNEALRPEGK